MQCETDWSMERSGKERRGEERPLQTARGVGVRRDETKREERRRDETGRDGPAVSRRVAPPAAATAGHKASSERMRER